MSDYLKISNLNFSYGKQLILNDLNLSLKKGEIHCLLGPSGCGKSTLLQLILGLKRPDQGEIVLGDNIYASKEKYIEADKREVGIVFQDYALFPHMNVYENISFAFSKKDKNTDRLHDLISLVKLNGKEKKYPEHLSGGEQQRVAIARALVKNPSLLLLDEAFSNLDPHLRGEIREEVKEILKKENMTSLFITHDHEESLILGERISVMNQGKIIQTGTPREVLKHPATLDVARFFGKALFLKGENAKKLFNEDFENNTTIVIPYSCLDIQESNTGFLLTQSFDLGFAYRLIFSFEDRQLEILYTKDLDIKKEYCFKLKNLNEVSRFNL